MSPTETTLMRFNTAVARHLQVPPADAWETSLDLLAWQSRLINSSLPLGFTAEEAEETLNDFDRGTYYEEGWDYLGECYCRLQGHRQVTDLMPRRTAEETAVTYARTNPDIYEEDPIRVLDPACGTGRYLIAAHNVFKEKGFYMGCEEKTVFYKMALLNLVLLGIPGAIINADNMCVDFTDDATWDACNEWP